MSSETRGESGDSQDKGAYSDSGDNNRPENPDFVVNPPREDPQASPVDSSSDSSNEKLVDASQSVPAQSQTPPAAVMKLTGFEHTQNGEIATFTLTNRDKETMDFTLKSGQNEEWRLSKSPLLIASEKSRERKVRGSKLVDPEKRPHLWNKIEAIRKRN